MLGLLTDLQPAQNLVVVGLEDARVGLVVIYEVLLTCNLLKISTHEHAPGLVLNLENNTLLIRFRANVGPQHSKLDIFSCPNTQTEHWCGDQS